MINLKGLKAGGRAMPIVMGKGEGHRRVAGIGQIQVDARLSRQQRRDRKWMEGH